jgi:ABC-type antimicrobial peptide transport system permease subunit
MGIRKIQGASVPLIMYLSGKKFLIVLVVASILGCIGGYYMSVMLLDSIWDYFIDINIGILLAASAVMIAATILTIAFKIINAAKRNPVDSLRYE